MSVQTARRIGIGATGLWSVVFLAALPTVFARAQARGDRGGFALVLALLALGLIGFVASIMQRRRPVSEGAVREMLLACAALTPILVMVLAPALGWNAALRPAGRALLRIVAISGATRRTPEGWAPKEEKPSGIRCREKGQKHPKSRGQTNKIR